MEKQLIPNSTLIPNILLDFVLPELPAGEMRCLLYICRRTYGFHKDYDRISFTQFIFGITGKDKGCGVSRPVVAESLRNLAQAGAITTQKSKLGNIYKINLDMDPEGVVRKVNQLRKLTESSKESKPKQVRLLNLQNKGNIGNKEVFKNLKNETNETSNRKGQLLEMYKVMKSKGIIKKLNPEYEAIIAGEKSL